MQTSRDKKLGKINDTFSYISSYVSLSNCVSQNDINNDLVDFFIYLLDMKFESNLINANHISENYPAIDLIDKKKRIAVQVTSTDTFKKKRETHEKFFKHNLDSEYDVIYMFFLKSEGNTRIPKVAEVPLEKMKVIDFRDLFKFINTLGDAALDAILKHMDNDLIYDDPRNMPRFRIGAPIKLELQNISGFLNQSSQFTHGIDVAKDLEVARKTYENLFNKINKLSRIARKFLVFLIMNSNNLDNNNECKSYFTLESYLNNENIENNYNYYIDELIGSQLVFLEDEYIPYKSDYAHIAYGVYFADDLNQKMNAFAFLIDYLESDVKKINAVLVDLNFDSLN